MYYELALISVAIGGAYWGWQFVRQESMRLYGALNLLSALLAGLGFLGERDGDDRFGLPGAIGLGAGVCLLVVGPVLRGLARRAAVSERFGLAARLLDIAEILAPGSGVGHEKGLLAAMREIRDGKIEKTVEALTAAKYHASPEAQVRIDERIALLYLAAYRWDEAITHAEAHLFGAIPPSSEVGPGIALRRVLGIEPSVWVELLGAYAHQGDLDQAARMLARLEDVCVGRPDAGIWLHRGRLVFLALAGRVGAVQTLVDRKRAKHMKASARTYWMAVAHERHGETKAAEAAYAKARAGSRGRPRELIDQAIARLPNVKPAELGPMASDVVARVEAEPVPIVDDSMRPRRPWAIRTLVASMGLVALSITIFLGPSTDVGVLVRDGAMVRSLVHDGEWWRIVSAMFIHVGGIHLLNNLVGIWLIGRLAEGLFGGFRTLVIFALAGLAGCFASYLASPAGISAGASGGMFGLLGAVFVEVTLHRKRYRGWPRGMWGSLALVTVAQVGVGFLYPLLDQWAHGGGLVIGALVGALLSPHVPWQRIGLQVARVIAVAFAGVAGFAAVMVVRTSTADSLARSPLVRLETATYSAVAPASWSRSRDEIGAEDVYMVLLAQRGPGTVETLLPAFTEGEHGRAKDKSFDQIENVPDRVIPLPPAFQGTELVASVGDSLGSRQRYRVVVAGRPDGDGVVLASLYVPETIARSAPAFFTNLLASIRAR